MSRFTGLAAAAQPGTLQLRGEPYRDTQRNLWSWETRFMDRSNAKYREPYWGFSRGMSGDAMGGWISSLDASSAGVGWDTTYENPDMLYCSGANSSYYICGITRDSSGAALGVCVVDVYLTATETWVSQCVSGPTGEFCASVYSLTSTYFLVAYKVSSPDLAGTTANTLVGSATRIY